MSKHTYDYFVIGAGSGGVRSARIAATHGAKVGIAESSALGGTCVNLGCVPKKLLAYAADYSLHFEDARGYGWSLPESPAFDWPALIANKNREIARLNGAYQNTLENAGVDILRGHARLTGPKDIEINGMNITADKILIATGGKPRRPTIPGGEFMATSDDVFFWPSMPRHVVIQGGGYVAVEFAHIFHGLGAHVTLLYRGDLFLRGFDRDIGETLAAEMRKQGIDLRFEDDAIKIEKNGPRYSVHTHEGNILECDLALSAIGRDPNTEGLGLDRAGVKLAADGKIAIDAQYQTSQPGIYALGDVANHHTLTPVAIKEGHVLADRLFGNLPERSVNYENIATAVFSHPPIAVAGLSEEQARKAGHEITMFKSNFRPMKHTLGGRDERTLMKLVVDAKTDRVLGIHMIGQDAPEILQGFAVALNCHATKADFDRTMAMHPTSAEEFVTMR
jgi:glutathione reductase (NADPH)